MTALLCASCGAMSRPRLLWRRFSRGEHLGAYCGRCHAWIRWVPQTEDARREAPTIRNAAAATRTDVRQGTLF
jgi:hypothetical protein